MFREVKKLLGFTCGSFRFIFLLILRSPVDLMMTAINAVFLQQAFNAVERNNVERLNLVCLVFGIASLCIFIYNGTIWSIYAPFVVRMEKRLRIKLLIKITKFSYERIENTSSGDWFTRLNTDVQMPFTQPIHFPHAVNAILRISVSAFIIWHINPVVFGWVMIFIAPHIITSQFLVAWVMPQLNKISLEAMANNTDELSTIITCADIAAIYDGHGYFMKRYEKSSLELRRVKMKIINRNALNTAILPLFSLSGYLVLLIASSSWIANGNLTFGDLTAVFQYRGGVLIGSMMLINCIISIQASMAGIRRINETMSEKTEEQFNG